MSLLVVSAWWGVAVHPVSAASQRPVHSAAGLQPPAHTGHWSHTLWVSTLNLLLFVWLRLSIHFTNSSGSVTYWSKSINATLWKSSTAQKKPQSIPRFDRWYLEWCSPIISVQRIFTSSYGAIFLLLQSGVHVIQDSEDRYASFSKNINSNGQVSYLIQHCGNTPLQGKLLHPTPYVKV